MYDSSVNSTTIVGNTTPSYNSQGFKEDISHIFEAYQLEGVNITTDMDAINRSDAAKREFIDACLESVSASSALTNGDAVDDPFYGNYSERLDQLISNSMLDMAREAVMTGYSPIQSYAPFMIKKQWVACVWKDVLMTEVTSNPIIKIQMEKRWVKDLEGNRYQIPDVYYQKDIMKKLLEDSTGIPLLEDPIELPMQGICLIDPSKNTDTSKKYIKDGFHVVDPANSLTHDIHIWKVIFSDDSKEYPVACDIKVDVSTGSFVKGDVTCTIMNDDGTVKKILKDTIVGSVDFTTGTISVFASYGKIKKICLRGKTANRFNHRSLDVERTIEPLTYYMPESGPRLNSAVTIEEAQDAIALGKIDMFADNVDMMGDVLANLQDIDLKMFVDTSFETQKAAVNGPFGYGNLIEEGSFNAVPIQGYGINITDWMTQGKEYFERTLENLKYKLNTSSAIIMCVCHPSLVRYLKADVRWIFTDSTDISGLKISYNVGVSTANGDRMHIVTSSYMSPDEGVKILVIPTTTECITFKSLMYSIIVDRGYKHPLEPLVPNVMSTQRYLAFEVVPVQGRFTIEGRELTSPSKYSGTFEVTQAQSGVAGGAGGAGKPEDSTP